jgi:hypothetical protein
MNHIYKGIVQYELKYQDKGLIKLTSKKEVKFILKTASI